MGWRGPICCRSCAALNRTPRHRRRWTPGDASSAELAVRGLAKFASRPVSRPVQLASLVPSTVSTVADIVRRARSGRAMAAPFRAPRTRFNDSITRRRNIAFARLNLEDIKTVKNRFGVTVNDVVMALCAGVLRNFLLDRDQLPETSLVATVPVSVHGKSGPSGRNQVSAMFSRLQTSHRRPG